jgi:hypothetical protein
LALERPTAFSAALAARETVETAPLHAFRHRRRHLGRGDLRQEGLDAGRDERLAGVEDEILRDLALVGAELRPFHAEHLERHAARRRDSAVVEKLAGHMGEAHDDGVCPGRREQALAQRLRQAGENPQFAL